MLRNLIGQVLKPKPADYEKDKETVQSDSARQRKQVALRQDSKPELLYFLAGDDDPNVRLAVAENPNTPAHAYQQMVDDDDEEVRTALAKKITRLLPELNDPAKDKVRMMTTEAIEALSRDQLPKVRAALAQELCRMTDAPKHVVMALARDLEAVVSVPVLEYSPLLSDADLAELIAAGVAIGAMPAIARREGVGEAVTDAIIATADVASVAALLRNRSARIRQGALEQLAEDAEQVEAYHEPMVMRPDLSRRAIKRLAGFVARSLLMTLSERNDLDDDLRRDLSKAVQRRLDQEADDEQDVVKVVERMVAGGTLDDEVFCKALDDQQKNFALHALAGLSGFPLEAVNRILSMRNAKAATALTWKAGLSMRTALRVQHDLAHVPPSDMLQARNGLDFPMDDGEMELQISHIG